MGSSQCINYQNQKPCLDKNLNEESTLKLDNLINLNSDAKKHIEDILYAQKCAKDIKE